MTQLPYAKKSLGQHWLTDESSLKAICDAGMIEKEDNVLEIGPGFGNLTKLLAQKAKHIYAVELDKILASNLSANVRVSNLTVYQEDILKFDLNKLPTNYKVVANIPYYLTSNLIRVLSESTNPPQSAVLLVQKEVAERVIAGPGETSLLSITAQYYWGVEQGIDVPARLFTPPPKVDSRLLILKRKDSQFFKPSDADAFFRLVKAGFSERRKKLRSSLSGGLGISKESAEQLLKQANIDPGLRAQALTMEDWYRLYKASV